MSCSTTQRRRQERIFAVAAQAPTVPTVADHCTTGWLGTDIYKGELVVNTVDQKLYSRGNTGIFEITASMDIGDAVGGGTADRILYIDNSGNLFGDAKFTRDSTTNFTSISATVGASQSCLAMNDDLFGLGILEGISIHYTVGTEIYHTGASSQAGTPAAACSYIDSSSGAVTVMRVTSTDAEMYVNADSGENVGVFVADPDGTIIVGKDSGSTNHVLIMYDNDGTSNELFSLRNDGVLKRSGRVQQSSGATVASANDLTLGYDGNSFPISGTATINAITTTDWQNGSTVILGFTGIATVKHNTAGGAGTEPMVLSGGVDLVTKNNDSLVLVRYGGFWNEIARKIS